MKATVVESKDGFAAVLKEDGTIMKMKSEELKIGDVIMIKEKSNQPKRRLAAIVAAAAMFLMMVGGAGMYSTPSYYVSLDVNPSIVMEVNRFERVISMDALNEEAREVLEGLELKNKDVEEAMSMAVERIAELGYFNVDNNNILISATAKDKEKAEKLTGKLQESLEEDAVVKEANAEVNSDTHGFEMVQAAKEIEGMSPGKYNIIVNLLGIDPENAEEYVDVPVRELMAEFTASKGAEGRARAEEAKANKDSNEENEELAENAEIKNEAAERKENNAPINTPASDRKSPNANQIEKNEIEKKPEVPEKPEIPEKPEFPEKPEIPEPGRP